MLVFGKFDLSTKFTVCLHWFLVRYCEILRIIKSDIHNSSYVLTTHGNCNTVALRFSLSIYCLFFTSKLHYKWFSYNDIIFIALKLHFLSYAYITNKNNVMIMFCFCSPLWSVFLLGQSYAIYLFHVVRFFMTLELRYTLARSNYEWK